MNLVIIVLVAAVIVAMVIISNSSKNTVEETPEPLVNPNFGLDLEDPAAPVQAPEEVVVSQPIVSDEELEKLAEAKGLVKKAVKSPAVKKSAKAVAKTTAKAAPKKTVVKKTK
jgi:hypothetical protein